MVFHQRRKKKRLEIDRTYALKFSMTYLGQVNFPTTEKPHKKNQEKNTKETSSFRPLCIISCIEKLFEQATNNRLKKYIEDHKLFSENHFDSQ